MEREPLFSNDEPPTGEVDVWLTGPVTRGEGIDILGPLLAGGAAIARFELPVIICTVGWGAGID